MFRVDRRGQDRYQRGGGQVVVLLLLLAVIAGGGAYNYHRNVQAELQEEGPRPFEGYSDADLEALASAYEADAEDMAKRFETARSMRGGVQDTQLLADGIVEFERVQRSAARIRQAGAKVAEREVVVDQIREEQRARNGEEGMTLHVRRLFTL